LIANFDKIVKAIQPVIDQFKKMADFLGLTDFAGEEAAKNEKKRRADQLQQHMKEKENKSSKYAEDATKDNQQAKLHYSNHKVNRLNN
jgi:hypothetical protein